MSIKYIRNEKGIGLVETILALGIAVVVITSLVSLAVYTLRSSQQSKFLLEGSKLAAEQIELLRVVKDKEPSWDQYKSDLVGCVGTSAKCHVNSAIDGVLSNEENLPVSNSSQVTRYFYIQYPNLPDQNIIRVTSIVTWEVGPSTKTTSIITDITNWKNQ